MLRVLVLELPARWNDREGAFAEMAELLGPASKQAPGEARLVVVPELAFTGYVSPTLDFDLRRFAEPIDGPTVAAACAFARRHATHFAFPLVLREGPCVYNAIVWADPNGQIVATYRKRHPWLPERWATPGAAPTPLLAIAGLEVAIAICYDGHFLEQESAAVLARADLLVFPSAWVDDEDSRMPLLQGLSRRFDLAIANPNWARGGVLEIPGQGGSVVLDASGGVLAGREAGSSGPGRIEATIGKATKRT
jgi:5-aminopentanamidase